MYHCKEISLGYACTEIRCLISRKFMLRRGKPVPLNPELAKERYLLPFFTSLFADVVKQYQNVSSEPHPLSNAPIWVCWLQGEELAPATVKQFIGNIRQKSNGHPVHVLDLKNYVKYITLPDFIETKYRNNTILPQHFTDIIRTVLLAKHGGLWIDATGLITRPIPNEAFDSAIYNVKDICPDFLHKNVVIDSTKWMNYLLGGQPGAVTYQFIRDCLFQYWKHYDDCIDYFLMFYIAKIGREQVPACKMEYNAVPTNNYLCEILNDAMERDMPSTQTHANKYLNSNTWFYKLSWRTPYPLETPNHCPTLSHFIFKDVFRE